ncbi:MAG: hypothetical protein IK017_10675 [Paludibacteraceae bacterium]|nr:hypothetical protein [Paludibacteraceae bacterium]MBR5973099.1 hypothetical protein [Paludibacteraceae bacterium]
MGLKRIITTSVCILMGMMLLGKTPTHLTVELTSDSTYDFLLTEKPVLTFESGNLVVNGDSETSYSIEGVKNFHFTHRITGNKDIRNDEIRFILLDEATIQVQNIESESKVMLLGVMGTLISSVSVDSDGTATVSLPATKGVYILSVAGKSIKIIRK